MNKTLKILLVGVTITSSAIAINKNITLNELKLELASKQEENTNLTNKLEHSSDNINKLNQKNKKLTKRVVNEINKIISLKDSVDNLGENLKEDQKKLAQKDYWTKRLLREKKWLKKEIQKNKKAKKNKKESSKTNKLNVTKIETTLMRKKYNGSFVETDNSKKIDAFKTNFKILNNKTAKSGKKKINISVFNSKNKNLAFNDVLEIDYNNENLDVISIIEVERKKIERGTYNIIAYIDGKEVNSSLAYIE